MILEILDLVGSLILFLVGCIYMSIIAFSRTDQEGMERAVLLGAILLILATIT